MRARTGCKLRMLRLCGLELATKTALLSHVCFKHPRALRGEHHFLAFGRGPAASCDLMALPPLTQDRSTVKVEAVASPDLLAASGADHCWHHQRHDRDQGGCHSRELPFGVRPSCLASRPRATCGRERGEVFQTRSTMYCGLRSHKTACD